MEEKQLIEGCVRGEMQSQKKMYEQYAPAMMSVCMRYVCNRETARDLLQDGFIKLFAKIHSYSGKGSFNGWMRKIFVTTILEHFRRKDVLRYSVDIDKVDYQSDDDEVSHFDSFTEADLLKLIATLPNGYRTVFNMYAIEKFSHSEIAKELKISENTSRTQYMKAKKLLRKMLWDEKIINSLS